MAKIKEMSDTHKLARDDREAGDAGIVVTGESSSDPTKNKFLGLESGQQLFSRWSS